MRKVACVPLGFFLIQGRGGEGHGTAALWGVLGSVKEMKAGDGMVLLASVCERRDERRDGMQACGESGS